MRFKPIEMHYDCTHLHPVRTRCYVSTPMRSNQHSQANLQQQRGRKIKKKKMGGRNLGERRGQSEREDESA